MRRLLVSLTTGALLLVANPALAAFKSPSELFSSLLAHGGPRQVALEFHGNDGASYFSMWVSGSYEGWDLAHTKSKMWITIDTEDAETWMRLRLQYLIYQKNLYVQLQSVDVIPKNGGSAPMGLHDLAGTWVTMPMDEMLFPDNATFLQSLLGSLTEMDMDVDRIFTMEYSRYSEGFVYSIHPTPEFFVGHVPVYDDEPQVGMSLGEWLRRAREEWDEPVYTRPQDVDVNVHIKVDTNTADELLFAKFYMSHRDLSSQFVVQGTLQHSPTPVYLEIPEKALSPESFFEELFMEMPFFDALFLNFAIDSSEWEEMVPTDEWGDPYVDDVWQTNDGTMEFEQEPVEYDWSRVTAPYAPRVVPATPSWSQESSSIIPPSCQRLRGTPEYTFLVRKGTCPPDAKLRGYDSFEPY